ncbi:unnamed protein product [Taenia asiatica]|uniref:Uncharacterized protein n=1 Tax=Taenia asiatica TaxID=60517 RepID=A0A0R3VW05_TAEAS|nr:unnamed protein product [Taenia asiatica]
MDGNNSEGRQVKEEEGSLVLGVWHHGVQRQRVGCLGCERQEELLTLPARNLDLPMEVVGLHDICVSQVVGISMNCFSLPSGAMWSDVSGRLDTRRKNVSIWLLLKVDVVTISALFLITLGHPHPRYDLRAPLRPLALLCHVASQHPPLLSLNALVLNISTRVVQDADVRLPCEH